MSITMPRTSQAFLSGNQARASGRTLNNTVSMRLCHIVLKTMLLKPDYLHQLFGNLVKMQVPVLKIWTGPVILHFQQAPKGYGCC